MTQSTIDILTWKEAIEVNQDPLGIQGTECFDPPTPSPHNSSYISHRYDAIVGPCNGSTAQEWSLNGSDGMIRQASSGLCLGVDLNGTHCTNCPPPLHPGSSIAQCENRVTVMACGDGGENATRWMVQSVAPNGAHLPIGEAILGATSSDSVYRYWA